MRHELRGLWWAALLALIGLSATCPDADAAQTSTFGDRASFLADTGASATAPIPNVGFVGNSRTVGDLRFSVPHLQGMFMAERSARIEGYEIGINDREHLDITLASPVYALGFDFVEPRFDPLVNATFFDSTFTVTLRSGGASGTIVASFTFNAPEDTLYFVGVWSDAPFDRVEVRETVGNIENEWFGQFYTGTDPLAANARPVADAGQDQSARPGITVTLDGSGSSDPDDDYPLSYEWSITSRPQGSAAVLSDPTVVNPTFVPDLAGDYRIELIVTDATGLRSTPDEVLISTTNVAPVAEAGPDQTLTLIGSAVQLDGTQSYDDDGDDFTYQWTITAQPEGSSAELSDPTSATPTFVPDLYGEYVISLVVTDTFGAASAPDSVMVSFDNLKPVADAGDNQAAVVGDTIALDGSGSSDPNGDPLIYYWGIVSAPDGSSAALASDAAPRTSFVADLAGEYVVSLVVSDGLLDSDPSSATIMVISRLDAATGILIDVIEAINALDPGVFKNANMQKALTNKINAVLALIEEGSYADAASALEHDILAKMDGCAATGTPDANDWIIDCQAQVQLYDAITRAIALLS